MRAGALFPALRRFLDDRGHVCVVSDNGFDVVSLDVVAAIVVGCAFFQDVAVDGDAEEDDRGTLLFQVSPARGTWPASVNLTRQIYGGAGHSLQLGITLDFDAIDLETGENFWSTTDGIDGDVDVFASMALSRLAALGLIGRAPRRAWVGIDRF